MANNSNETPKGTGRPTKKRGFNFGKPKKLDFTPVIPDDSAKSDKTLEDIVEHVEESDNRCVYDDEYYNHLYKEYEASELNNNSSATDQCITENSGTNSEDVDKTLEDRYHEKLHNQYMFDEDEYYSELYKEYQAEEGTDSSLKSTMQCNEANSLPTQIHEDVASINYSIINRKFPVKLRNDGVNVCFFNSIIQALYSIPLFHTYLEQASSDDIIVHGLKNLFETMRNGNGIVLTSTYINQFDFNNYTFGRQHDAQEALAEILDSCYPDNNQSIFRVKINESLVCERTRGGCGATGDRYECHQILPLQIVETSERLTVQNIVDSPFNYHMLDESGGPPEEYYRCTLGLQNGCNKTQTCSKASLVSELKDLFIIHLHIFTYNDSGEKRKIFPAFHVEQQITIFDNYSLEGIVWHHGQNLNSGHYTSMVKHSERWYHISDTDVNTYPIKFSCNSGERSVPYLLFYKRNNNVSVSNVSLDTAIYPAEPESIDFSIHPVMSKESKETLIDELNDDELQSIKKRKLDNDVDDLGCRNLEPLTELDEQASSICNADGNDLKIDQKKFNFSKRKKHVYSTKKVKCDKTKKQKLRSTPEGKEQNRRISERIRNTPAGKMKNQETAKEGMKKTRSTDEGQEQNRKLTEQIRAAKKAKEKEDLENVSFPPVISDEKHKECLIDFIGATSPSALEPFECGICGEFVRKGNFQKLPVDQIPGRELLSVDEQPDEAEESLDEYKVNGLLLSRGGFDEQDQSVVCCNTCLYHLKKQKLPPLSIANNFQIGRTPPELTDLTLPEKLLISVYRPKIHVVKLRSSNGPGTRQLGLKGNTITFPQDIVKIASTLPANPDILIDHLKVVFLGNNRPTREMLKKVLTVRRHKVYDALNFLIANHPLYKDVTLSTDIDLPIDDVPDQIMNTLHAHEDPDDEDANEHSTYTPQTDIDDVPDDTVLLDSTGIVDVEGSSVHSTDQLNSAIHSLQGTLYVPHGSTPVNEYNNPNLWLGAYPWLFPYGKGAPEITRKVSVSLKAYVKHILLLADRKFSRDCSFKFHAFNIIQRRAVSLHTSLVVRKQGFHSTAARIDSLTEESMTQLQQSVQNRTPITDPNLRTLMNTLSSTGAQIHGSPYQKSAYRREIFGLMIQKGTPVLWITISPAVSHSPIFLQISGHNVLDLSQIPSHIERAKMVANDPVSAAIYFNLVIDSFTKYLLGYKQPGGGNFGYPSAYYGMTEEQGTGTLHNHMLVWLHGFTSASNLKSKLEDTTFKKDLIDYLESIIKQGYLGEDPVDENCDVSEVSCRYPINPSDFEGNPSDFEEKFIDDVNKLVRVANTHSCRNTCYKRRTEKICRFNYPREECPDSYIDDDNVIHLKRTSEYINNYNPETTACVRSNTDIKFIPSGKDGKNVTFYITDYATKSQLSTHQMVPLIAASKKKVDVLNATDDVIVRSKALITKCLNRITTESEISGSHVSHFLLGHLDKKTSHSFTGLNLHSAIRWLENEKKKYDDFEQSQYEENAQEENPTNPVDEDPDDDDDDDDNNDDDEESTEDNTTYSISTGNTGYVLVNQMIDYINRGDELSYMCLYEYCSKVYKTTFTNEEKEKHLKKDKKGKLGRRPSPRYLFKDDHPQSETHWQTVRADGLVPSLSMLPPSIENNKEKYQKCILLLFKPFHLFTDLYNGTSWDDSYESTEFTDNDRMHYINNIQEMHIGLKEKQDTLTNDNNVVDENDVVDVGSDDWDIDNTEVNETEIDLNTTEALDIIKNTGWLEESTSHVQTTQPAVQNNYPLRISSRWKRNINKQNRDKLNNELTEQDDEVDQPGVFPIEYTDIQEDDIDVGFSVEATDDVDYDEIATRIVNRFSLNKKQKVAFELAIRNVIKREREEETQQVIGYVGGPGGTGKSQVIKAIVAFHEEIKVKHKLKMCAYTGTAAKHIGGSTTATLFNFKNPNSSILETRFKNVNTIILDEVSMIGCRQLAKISKRLTQAKHANPNLPFGGVDIIFFGDFVQFPPIKDSPLYCAWTDRVILSAKSNSEINLELGIHLWRQVNHIVLLDEQMRVTDLRYQELLNRLREGKCNDSDIALLNTRVLENTVDLTSMSGNPIICPGNKLVTTINTFFATGHSEHKTVFLSTAADSIKNKKVPPNLVNLIKNFPSTRTNGLPRELPLYVGMPVFLTDNIATELGLTNGTTGVVRSIHFKDGTVVNTEPGFRHLPEMPEYIIVELDGVTMTPLDGLLPNHVPIFPKKGSFGVKLKGREEKIKIKRCHFPLVPRFSCTAHKSQGQTLSKAIVDLVKPPENRNPIGINFSYVPLSRVRTLRDLTILRPFDTSILNAAVHVGCTAMMAEFKARDMCKDI